MYGEFFDIPAPDELIFLSTFSGGEVFRSGCTFRRGHGKIFYFRPGDQDYPTYHHRHVRRVIANAVRWARTDRPERRYPELLRYESGEFFEGHGYRGAMATREPDADAGGRHSDVPAHPEQRHGPAARRRRRRRRMGRAWLAAIRGAADADVVGVADVDTRRARAAAGELAGPGVPPAPTPSPSLARRTHRRSSTSPSPAAHHPVTTPRCSPGSRCWGRSRSPRPCAEALSLAAAAEVSGKLFMVSQSRRWNPQRLRAARAGPRARHRSPLATTRVLPGAPLRWFPRGDGEPLCSWTWRIHPFDSARYVLGSEPLSVYCEAFNPAWSWFDGRRGGDAVFDVRRTAPGTRTSAVGSPRGARRRGTATWRISGREGTAVWDGEGEVTVQNGEQEPERVVVAPGPAESIDGSLADFVKAIRSGAPPSSGEIHDNVLTLAMVEAAVRSASTGERVGIGRLVDEAWQEALQTDLRADHRAALAAWGSAADRLAVGS